MGRKSNRPPKGNKSGNTTGAILLFLGLLLLMKNLDIGFHLPRWFFGWEMILIAIGLVIGVNSGFRKRSSVILLMLGGAFLLKNMFHLPFGRGVLPLLVIAIGIYLILRNRKKADPDPFRYAPEPETDEFDWDRRVRPDEETAEKSPPFQRKRPNFADRKTGFVGENHIKVDTVFGEEKKIVFSKDFLGGNITNIFGSTEINLLQAEIQRPIAIDVFQLFGSTKIIVPPHWVVSTTVSSVLSENQDRRVIHTRATDQNKQLYITGSSIMGSITLKN